MAIIAGAAGGDGAFALAAAPTSLPVLFPPRGLALLLRAVFGRPSDFRH
jgi:hypothetical protein